jgi:hypothetical protein
LVFLLDRGRHFLAENKMVVPATAIHAPKGAKQKGWQNQALEQASATGATHQETMTVRTMPEALENRPFHWRSVLNTTQS